MLGNIGSPAHISMKGLELEGCFDHQIIFLQTFAEILNVNI